MSLERFLEKMTQNPSLILNIPIINEVTGEISEYDKLPIVVSDESYRYQTIMGEHTLNLKFSLPGYCSIPIGTYCEYQRLIYTLEVPENIKKNGEGKFEYDLILQSDQYKLSKFILRNIVPGDSRLKFSYTARPHEFMRLLVENMNARDPEQDWSFDEEYIVESFEKTVSFNHNTCLEALQMISEAFETEWEIFGKELRLRKVEYNKLNSLPMSYGKGNGFLPGLGRSEYGDIKPVERLFVQGGNRNIDSSKYRRTDATGQTGSRELLMPADTSIKYDGTHFDDEPGFNPDSSGLREYITDADGMSVCRYENRARKLLIEDSLDASGIYPMREGTVATVDPINPDKNLYDFTDNDPVIPNYTNYLIKGETMTVIFQTGMLTGKEFDVTYTHPGVFKIVPQALDGQNMPGGVYIPRPKSDTYEGDKYAIFHCMLPTEYIKDAERRMLKKAVKYLYDNEMPKFTFTGTMDSIWAKRDWINIGGRLVLGGFIRFSDNQFLPEGMDIRITGIKDYVNNPYSPIIELSNNYKSNSPIHRMKRQINSEEVATDTKDQSVVQFAKRRFRDVQETMDMLQDSMLNFSAGTNPVYVNTMMMLVGEEGLQFDYSEPVGTFRYDPSDGKFHTVAGTITHDTLADSQGVRLKWDMPSWDSAEINTDEFKNNGYFVYAKVLKPGRSGDEDTFMLSETAIPMNGDPNYYHLLVGILNSEFDGDRSFAQMYGLTEILPGRITTDRIVSADGNCYFDMKDSTFKLTNDLEGDDEQTIEWANGLLRATNMTIKDSLKVEGTALIAGLLFSNEVITSSTKTEDGRPRMVLNGVDGSLQFNSRVQRWTEKHGEEDVDQFIRLHSDYDATIEVREANGNSVSYMSSQGIFANRAGIQATPSSSGIYLQGAIVGLGFGDMDNNAWGGNWGICGVYGDAYNGSDDPAPAFGGYFRRLKVVGEYYGIRKITTNSNVTLNAYDRFVSCYNTSNITIYLPPSPIEGQVIDIRKNYANQITVNANGKKILNNSSAVDSTTISTNTDAGNAGRFVWDGSYWLHNVFYRN